MNFMKMQGAGNDFIVINNIEEKVSAEKLPLLAQRLCRRRFSIGADGLMALNLAKGGGDYRLDFYNSDGSIGEMCGNGARCIARYAYDKGIAGAHQRIETKAGIVEADRISEEIYRVRLNTPSVIRENMNVKVSSGVYCCTYIEEGNPGIPHAVLEVPDLNERDGALLELGRQLRSAPAFVNGANINFYKAVDEHTILLKTYERGVEDFTLACGTGSGAAALAFLLKARRSCGSVRVQNQGGLLTVEITKMPDDHYEILLTGPARPVAEGKIIGTFMDFMQ